MHDVAGSNFDYDHRHSHGDSNDSSRIDQVHAPHRTYERLRHAKLAAGDDSNGTLPGGSDGLSEAFMGQPLQVSFEQAHQRDLPGGLVV